MRIISLILFICAIFYFASCKKEAANCVNWIVSDGWENAKGESLQDYNRLYGFKTGYDLPVCGIAKDTVFTDKKVVLRTMNDTAFYVRVYKVIDNGSN